MAVAHQLARGERRRHELGAVDHRIQPALQQADHVLAGVARAARGFDIIFVELPLGDVAVIALQLLLGLKLRAVIGKLLGAALAVLARAIGALVDRALGAAPEVFAHAAVELVFGSRALAHAEVQFGGKRGFPGASPRGKPAQYSHGLLPVKPFA